MKEYIIQMLSNDSNKSSARLINIMGAILAALLLATDTAMHGKLDPTNFGLFLAYCGGGFIGSKLLDKVGSNAIAS